jgi:hypothetical protein
MSEMVVITETSKITSLKLGMWLLYRPLLGGFQYVYVESLSGGYAVLSNGLTINADGDIVDPTRDFCLHEGEEFLLAHCEEVSLLEITREELDRRIESDEAAERRYRECEYKSEGWSPPENFQYGTDDEREIWASYVSK